MTTATTNQNTQQQQTTAPQQNKNPDISGTAVANSYQEKNITPTSQVKPSTQTYGNGAGYTVNNGQYSYDQRYGTYNKDIDYTAKKQMAEKGGNNKAAAYYEAMANQKVQSMYPNNPKYSTQDKYGSYLNQNSDRYLQYLSGNSDTAYDISSDMKGWIGDYNPTYQYSAEIKKAADAGDYKKAAVLEALMNQKIQKEGLPYIQQDNYSTYLDGLTQSDVNMAKYGADVSPTGRYYRVGDDGKAPKGLKLGDYVVTANGTWMVTGIDQNGNYTNAVPVNGNLNTSNYKGQYLTPDPILEQQGLKINTDMAGNLTPEQEAAMGLSANNTPLTEEQLKQYGITSDNPFANMTPEQMAQLGITFNPQAVDTSQFNINTPSGQAPTIQGVNYTAPDFTSNANAPDFQRIDMPTMPTEQEMADAAQRQMNLTTNRYNNQIDYATQTGAEELQHAYDESIPLYASQRGQADLQGDKTAKNAALYAEQRGDRGGIGQAQYTAAQIARSNQINQINTAQNKAASDTLREITLLRNKGEFEKADKLYDAMQQYEAKLEENKKWLTQMNFQAAQLAQSERNYENQYYQNVAEITGKYFGQNTMAANQANFEGENSMAQMMGTYRGQDLPWLQQANAELEGDYADRYGVGRNGEKTLAAQNIEDQRIQNYIANNGIDPRTGLPTMAKENQIQSNIQNLRNEFRWDPITGMPTASERDANQNAANNFISQFQFSPYDGTGTWNQKQDIVGNKQTFAKQAGYFYDTGKPTLPGQEFMSSNELAWTDRLGYSPSNPLLKTIDMQKFEWSKDMDKQAQNIQILDTVLNAHGIPSADLLSSAGITDSKTQTDIMWGAYFQQVADKYGIQNQYMIDPTMVSGYPSNPPGTSSITSGGGVGTTSTGSSGSGGSGGSSSRSSSSSSSAPAATPAKTGESKGVNALSQKQQNIVNRVVSASAKNTTMARTILANHEKELPANTVRILSDQINMNTAYLKK